MPIRFMAGLAHGHAHAHVPQQAERDVQVIDLVDPGAGWDAI
jgi:hypothetical protein